MINQSSSKLKCFTVPAEGSEAALVASTLISTYPNTTVGFQHLRDQQQVKNSRQANGPKGRSNAIDYLCAE